MQIKLPSITHTNNFLSLRFTLRYVTFRLRTKIEKLSRVSLLHSNNNNNNNNCNSNSKKNFNFKWDFVAIVVVIVQFFSVFFCRFFFCRFFLHYFVQRYEDKSVSSEGVAGIQFHCAQITTMQSCVCEDKCIHLFCEKVFPVSLYGIHTYICLCMCAVNFNFKIFID